MHRNMFGLSMTLDRPSVEHSLSVIDAASRGVPALVREAEHGEALMVTRRGVPVAYVLGVSHWERLNELESDLRDVALLLARAATDTGARTSLDDAISSFGYTRDELEAELEADLTRG
ncbi:unannotated protein [freshwater metagenome]|uniref:Unannotated protein n=1 Tax=freshwater metagenome TaxID=449393 RepID=A0A6J7P6Q0_9ZZZZ